MKSIYKKLKSRITKKAKRIISNSKIRRKETFEFGNITIRKLETGVYETTISHRGSLITLQSESHESLQDTLLELKIADLPLEKTIPRLSGRDVLRLLRIHKEPISHEVKSLDGNLQLLGLIQKEPEAAVPFVRNKEIHITQKGVMIINKLFYAFSPPEIEESLQHLVYKPLISRVLDDVLWDKKEYSNVMPNKNEDHLWNQIDSYLSKMAKRYPPFREVKAWYFEEKTRRRKVLMA